VILNTNARGVSARKHEPMCASIFGKHNVFVTKSAQEAKQAAIDIVKANANADNNKRKYRLVVPVGGDGTLAQAINDMCDAYLERDDDSSSSLSLSDAIENLPLIGYIPMGTGNGVGSSVGCRIRRTRLLPRFRLLPRRFFSSFFGRKKKKKRDDDGAKNDDDDNTNLRQTLQSLQLVGERIETRDDESRYNVAEVPMIEVCKEDEEEEEGRDNGNEREQKSPLPKKKGDLCFFAGVGFDSLMLDDFKIVKRWSLRTKFLPRLLGSVAGYCVALVALTLPKALTKGEHRIYVKLSTSDMDTLWVDHRRGDFVQPIARRNTDLLLNRGRRKNRSTTSSTTDTRKDDNPVVLFSGTTGICCAGTSPFYGGGLRLFPFARMTLDAMHLRLGRINPLVGFVNIPQIFAGSYREPSSKFGVIDFIGKDFRVEVRRTSNDKDRKTKGFPFQHSGESQGNFERFRLRVTDGKIRFVNFLEQRCISCDD